MGNMLPVSNNILKYLKTSELFFFFFPLWRLLIFIPKYGLQITFWKRVLPFSCLCFLLLRLCWYNLFLCFAFILVGGCPKVSSKFILVNYFSSPCTSLLPPLCFWLDAHYTLVCFTVRTGEKKSIHCIWDKGFTWFIQLTGSCSSSLWLDGTHHLFKCWVEQF